MNFAACRPVPLDATLDDAKKKCRQALHDPQYAGWSERLADGPRTSEGWQALLDDLLHDELKLAAFAQLRAALSRGQLAVGAKLERYALLQALPSALERIRTLALPEVVMHHYAEFCQEVAAGERHWEPLYDLDNEPHLYGELVDFAALKTFPIGDLSFGISTMPLLAPASQVRPSALPGFLCVALCAMRGGRPVIYPHINFGRKSLVLRREEYERFLWVLAKTVEMRPEMKGLNAMTWLNSSAVGEVFPHLAWMRAMFIEAGAYVIDTRPAPVWRYGFHYKNPKRLKLYQEGKFCPRHTLALWPRRELLEWAARRPELAPAGVEPVAMPDAGGLRIKVPSPAPATQTKTNLAFQLWNGEALQKRLGKIRYMVATFLLPVLGIAATAAAVFGWAALVPALLVGAVALHALQYYFSQ